MSEIGNLHSKRVDLTADLLPIIDAEQRAKFALAGDHSDISHDAVSCLTEELQRLSTQIDSFRLIQGELSPDQFDACLENARAIVASYYTESIER